MKRIICLLSVLLTLTLTFFLAGCNQGVKENTAVQVVATVFPAYDFARAVAGDSAEITMLLDPGVEIHSYEPSPSDILKIENCDVFIYVGGESDTWVDRVLSGFDTENKQIIKLTEICHTLCEHSQEENGEEKQTENHHHDDCDEVDEHVWMSPENAEISVNAIADALINADGGNSSVYRNNAKQYCSLIKTEAKKTKKVIENAAHKTMVVADRFPLKYFCSYYNIKYVSAFDACDLLADADASTVINLIDTVKKEGLNYVFYIENGSGYVANTVFRETGAKPLMINSLHSISADDFNSGMTYTDVMEYNRKALERGLG